MTSLRFDHFVLNRETVERIAVGPECRKMVTEHGEMAKAHARTLASAAVGRRAKRKHDHYIDAFEVEILNVHGITPEWPMTRAGARVSNSAPHANMIEFGWNNPKTGASAEGHFVLHDTLDWLLGFDTVRFEDEPEEDDEYDGRDGYDDDGYDDPYLNLGDF